MYSSVTAAVKGKKKGDFPLAHTDALSDLSHRDRRGLRGGMPHSTILMPLSRWRISRARSRN